MMVRGLAQGHEHGNLPSSGARAIDAKDDSGHSLRVGPLTAVALASVSERISMLQTGHKNIAVLPRSIRAGSVFRDNGAAAVGW